MDDIVNCLLQCYSLKTIKEYSIGNKMILLSLQGTDHIRNTTIDSVDLKGLHDHLAEVARHDQHLDAQWAIVKTASSRKDNILVSLRKIGIDQSPCLKDILLGKERKQDGLKESAKGKNPFELALSESLRKQGIASDVVMSK